MRHADTLEPFVVVLLLTPTLIECCSAKGDPWSLMPAAGQ